MSRESTESLIADHLAGSLDPDGQAELDRRRAEDPGLQAEIDELEIVWNAMDTITRPVPTERLRRRFDATVEAYRAGLEAQPTRPEGRVLPWRPRQLFLPIATAAAAMILGVIAGTWLVAGRPSADLEQLEGQVAALTRTVGLTLMQQPEATERLRGVRYTQDRPTLDDAVRGALLTAVRDDPNANVRLAAIDALTRFVHDETVRTGLRDALPLESAPLVQLTLVDLLLEIDPVAGRAAVARFRERTDLDTSVRQHIEHRLGDQA